MTRIAPVALLLTLLGAGCARPGSSPSGIPPVATHVEVLDARQGGLAAAFLAERDRAHLLVLASPT